MAKLSSDHSYVTVEKGDTLSGIASNPTFKQYMASGATYKTLAAINGISNPNVIHIGDKIYLKSKTSSSSSSSTKKTSMTKPVIKKFGLQSNADNTIFATWDWDKSSKTENYKTMWYYATGDGVWFVGSDSTTNYKQSTYSIPSNAKKVKFKVKPISKTHKVTKTDSKTKKKTTTSEKYFTEKWSSEKTYIVKEEEEKPETPSVPTVTITEKNKLTVRVDNIKSDAKEIEWYIVKDDKSKIYNKTDTIKTTTASHTLTVDAGGNYKARCRAISKNKIYSEWTDYSNNVPSFPSAPKEITKLKADSTTSVSIYWSKVSTAKSYTIEYTQKKGYFDSSPDNVQTKTIEAPTYNAQITGLESGKEYFFRVRATNDAGDSGYTAIKSIVLGKKPSAPTTWSSTTTAVLGEKVYLYWTHNSEDGSSQTYANLEITRIFADVTTTETISVKNSTAEDEKDKTSVFVIDTSTYKEGVEIKWRVQTKGIHAAYSDWSILRTIDIYAKPTLNLSVTDVKGKMLETLTSFPFYVEAIPGPETQAPIGYHVEIIANSGYETVDAIGNPMVVSEGDAIYSNFFDVSNQKLLLELSAQHLDLENGIPYTIKCIVAMDSGLTAEDSADFTVAWTDEEYAPNARINIDYGELTAAINPYCEVREVIYHVVTLSSGVYTKTSTIVNSVYGELVEGATTTTGEDVYYGSDDEGNDIYYCEVETVTEIDGVMLSVYRREYDGRFVEIMTGITDNNTFAVDPHPALDYARYRIVAITTDTGAVSYTDLPGVGIGESAIIIQWAEEWSSYNTFNEDELAESEHTASTLRLPYNVDVSDSNDPDVSLVEYVGRSHPVTYYGTQLGEKSTWSTEIPKTDVETLYALRRLRNWMGDVYVREPSGSGYWANIKVKYDLKHKDLTIPVTFDVTRVEGGM